MTSNVVDVAEVDEQPHPFLTEFRGWALGRGMEWSDIRGADGAERAAARFELLGATREVEALFLEGVCHLHVLYLDEVPDGDEAGPYLLALANMNIRAASTASPSTPRTARYA